MKKAVKAPRKKKASSDWHAKIEKMRETYPNAFRPWTKEDDEKLQQDFLLNPDLEVLSRTFGRHPGSIIARLKKHFGDDIVA